MSAICCEHERSPCFQSVAAKGGSSSSPPVWLLLVCGSHDWHSLRCRSHQSRLGGWSIRGRQFVAGLQSLQPSEIRSHFGEGSADWKIGATLQSATRRLDGPFCLGRRWLADGGNNSHWTSHGRGIATQSRDADECPPPMDSRWLASAEKLRPIRLTLFTPDMFQDIVIHIPPKWREGEARPHDRAARPRRRYPKASNPARSTCKTTTAKSAIAMFGLSRRSDHAP